ncbi:hypothetical protein SDC9_120031 [bioreactor metagenome]|uniref:Uncharacterized protein n=1 Tax=bioreactor metagenome TaxID=1076179 RepID=A0A645C667_9ZZZZ
MQVLLYDAVRFVVGISQVAGRLFQRKPSVQKRKRGRRFIAVLPLHLGIVQRSAVDARGRSGLEPLNRDAKLGQRRSEILRAE